MELHNLERTSLINLMYALSDFDKQIKELEEMKRIVEEEIERRIPTYKEEKKKTRS